MKRVFNSLAGSCPRCYGGKMWEYSPYNFKFIFKMNDSCSKCGQKFTPELGFYEGAMYVSYAINVAQVITFFTAFNILFTSIDFDWLIGMTISSVVLLAPLTFRWSKNIWAYLFISYRSMTEKKD